MISTERQLDAALAEVRRLKEALRPFATNFQINAGYCRDDFRRASEAYGEIEIRD